MANRVDLNEADHDEPPHQDLHCFQIQLFSSGVLAVLKCMGFSTSLMKRNSYHPTPKKGTKLVHFYWYKKGIPILYRIAKNIRNMANLIQNRYIYKNIDNIPFLCLKLCT